MRILKGYNFQQLVEVSKFETHEKILLKANLIKNETHSMDSIQNDLK